MAWIDTKPRRSTIKHVLPGLEGNIYRVSKTIQNTTVRREGRVCPRSAVPCEFQLVYIEIGRERKPKKLAPFRKTYPRSLGRLSCAGARSRNLHVMSMPTYRHRHGGDYTPNGLGYVTHKVSPLAQMLWRYQNISKQASTNKQSNKGNRKQRHCLAHYAHGGDAHSV